MAEEEVVYKVRLDASDAASKVASLEGSFRRLGNAVQDAFLVRGPATRKVKDFLELPGLSKFRSQMYDLYNWKSVKNNRQWISFFGGSGTRAADPNRRLAEQYRNAHRLHDQYSRILGNGTGAGFRGGLVPVGGGLVPVRNVLQRAFISSGISAMFGGSGGNGATSFGFDRREFAQRLLGFNNGISTWGFRRNPNADSIDAESWWSGGDESARTRRMRRPGATHDYRWEFRNPYTDDPFDFYVNRRRRRSWSDRIYSSIESLVPRGAARDVIGRISQMGPLGRGMGLFIAGILATTAALAIFKRAISLLFVPMKALADDVFKFYRTRHQIGDTAPGRGNGILSRMGWAGYIMGGKPEDNIALVQRIAAERASLLWGGGGGKYLSVARRFGVDISGSGRGGLATENEWLRNIAIRMMELDSEGKLALANEAGLSREQMWMVSNGVRYYDWASSRRTLGQMAWGGMLGKDIYTDNFQKESQSFWTDFGSFMMVFKEFIGSVGEILLPVINLILELLTGIFGLLNLVLKPIATLVGKIFSLLNISYWTNRNMMESSIPNYGKYDMGLVRETAFAHPNASIKTGDIVIQSSAANTTDAAEELADKFVSNVGLSRLYDYVAGGEERRIA